MALEIKQGVNESIKLELPFDPSLLIDFSIDVYQQGDAVIHKGASDCTVDGMLITAALTEADCMLLSPQRVSINFRGLYPDGGTVIIEDIPCPIRRSNYRTNIGCEGSCMGYCLGTCSTNCAVGCSTGCGGSCIGACAETCTAACMSDEAGGV